MDKCSLGNRMKMYENVNNMCLTRRTPVIIRMDGRAFHSLLRGMRRPFDDIFQSVMRLTLLNVCKDIQNCVLGYGQSDEMSLVLCDYKTLKTDAWFDNRIQKMCSISASMATMYFNKLFSGLVRSGVMEDEDDPQYSGILLKIVNSGAMFDSRVFNIPKEEVNNYFLWRQNDATRNSIQMVAQSFYSHKQLEGKSNNDMQEMLFSEHGVNWNDYPTYQRRGWCCVNRMDDIRLGVENLADKPNDTETLPSSIRYYYSNLLGEKTWYIDHNIPIFSQDPDYINRRLVFDE